MAKHPKYQIFTGSGGLYRFRLTAKNGQTMLQSQGYKSKAGCKNGIESVRKNSPLDERYEKKTSKNGKLFFNLLAANKQVVGTSEMYNSPASCNNGIESVKTNGPVAEVEDEG